MRTIFITGSAGYIGSHIAHELHAQGYALVLLDCNPHRYSLSNAVCLQGNYGDASLLDRIMAEYAPDAVIHCASYIDVGASVIDPLLYYHNNVAHTITLLDAMRRHRINKLIFSSSCAVYGNPTIMPIPEDHPHNPVSPYGATKSMIERILADSAHAYGIHYVALRYFNVAGMRAGSSLYEQHEPETHLIPRVLQAAYSGNPVTIFGTDYHTADGTCVRDFLHVVDIARAHYDALLLLDRSTQSHQFNLGTGSGYSVRQIIAALERVTGISLAIHEAPRRQGDPAALVADNRKAMLELLWQPEHSTLDEIMHSAHEGYQHAIATPKSNSTELQHEQ